MSVTGTPSRSAPGITPSQVMTGGGGGTMPLDDDRGGDGAALTSKARDLSTWPFKPKNLAPALSFLLSSAIRQLAKDHYYLEGQGDLLSALINALHHIITARITPHYSPHL